MELKANEIYDIKMALLGRIDYIEDLKNASDNYEHIEFYKKELENIWELFYKIKSFEK